VFSSEGGQIKGSRPGNDIELIPVDAEVAAHNREEWI
jgi:hypothetical protein